MVTVLLPVLAPAALAGDSGAEGLPAVAWVPPTTRQFSSAVKEDPSTAFAEDTAGGVRSFSTKLSME